MPGRKSMVRQLTSGVMCSVFTRFGSAVDDSRRDSMSVQAGVFHFDGATANSDWLLQTSASLREYGPDGEYNHIDGALGMLYRPFHTTAESRCERQPIVLPSGTVVMWDGRLDNRGALIRSMGLPATSESSDAVIVAGAFERYGTECFRKLIGDWAVSIWSPDEHTVLLARDYIG